VVEALTREAGFRSIEVHELPQDFQNYYYVCRPLTATCRAGLNIQGGDTIDSIAGR
jgi:hypothetical protein